VKSLLIYFSVLLHPHASHGKGPPEVAFKYIYGEDGLTQRFDYQMLYIKRFGIIRYELFCGFN